MHIGINGERLLITTPAGPEIYTLNLIHALAKIDYENTYTIYFNQEPKKEFLESLTANNSNFKYKVIKKIFSWTQISLALELLLHPVNIFFTAVHTMPVLHFVKVVAMIHGLEYKYSSDSTTAALPIWFTSKFSNSIVVPSEFTRNQLLDKKWGINEGKIKVISEGVSPEFSKKSEQTKPYLLFISTIEPRKNLLKLIEAFNLVLKELPDLKLYIAGKKGWNYEEVLKAPATYGISEKVRFLGRVPQEELPLLISEATAFVSTSLEEGFGLPLLEAMACQVPCVVSNIAAFKFIGLDYVSYVNPKDIRDIADKIIYTVLNPPSKEVLKSASDHAKSFTWKKSAQETLNLFKVI